MSKTSEFFFVLFISLMFQLSGCFNKSGTYYSMVSGLKTGLTVKSYSISNVKYFRIAHEKSHPSSSWTQQLELVEPDKYLHCPVSHCKFSNRRSIYISMQEPCQYIFNKLYSNRFLAYAISYILPILSFFPISHIIPSDSRFCL